MSEPNYVIRHRKTREFRAHADHPGPYTPLLQNAMTFSREEYAAAQLNDDEYTDHLEDILHLPDDSI